MARIEEGGRALLIESRAKADMIDAKASEDATSPTVRAFAAAIGGAKSPPDETVRRLLRYCQIKIAYAGDTRRKREAVEKYGEDPGVEELADPMKIVKRGYDDCDGKARCLVAFLRARGLHARIRPVFMKIGGFTHVQAEVRYPGSEKHPLAQDDGWLCLEPTAREALVGEDPLDVKRRTGQLLVHEK